MCGESGFLAESEGVDVSAGNCGGRGTKVEYPNDLADVSILVGKVGVVNRKPHTVTMDNRMYPAAVASMDATPL